ncbi:hypothetical protein DYE49_09700 [Treponema rectale]|uniref:Uncharacterized protein n=1 Tax=Treponema rectale TaxID=744512 RepID=A0A840SEU7_9SPIR|nr:hypothetical protein [Treponema rectale]MBB5219414.1 hypothetical protein [Treponema rectale]QOS40706.1 hypothetical protein DYE49_09700 [Treponema rectale]
MKFSKVLLGSAVLAAAAIGFMGYADDDDPNDMISGSNNNYSIEYTNDSTTKTSRGYNSTNLKHAGSLVKVNFDASSTTQGGVMGMIFDLHDGEDGKDFAVVGLRTTSSGAEYYVSYYTGVTNLQGDNFGAEYESRGVTYNKDSVAKETVIKDAFTTLSSSYVDTTDGTTVYVYFVETETADADFDYNVYFLPKSVAETVDDVDSNGNLLDSEGSPLNISSWLAATVDTSYTTKTQNKFAVYANVYAGSTVKGTWELLETYKAADVVED